MVKKVFIEHALNKWTHLIESGVDKLNSLSEEDFCYKQSASKWSKKEILGHLIDSATINHHRFVRVQFEHAPTIEYNQDSWNEFSFHQLIESEQLVSFWAAYNKQLIEITRRIPMERLIRRVSIGDSVFNLDFLIVAYVDHLEHHLIQVIEL